MSSSRSISCKQQMPCRLGEMRGQYASGRGWCAREARASATIESTVGQMAQKRITIGQML
eukprot:6175869-Pleurochrysis_carterae.AAC.2